MIEAQSAHESPRPVRDEADRAPIIAAPGVVGRAMMLDPRELQRSIGNRATGALLRRAPTRTGRSVPGVQREPSASKPGPSASSVPQAAADRVVFEGQILSPDPAITKDTLEKVGAEKGMVGIDGFVNRFTNPGVPTTVAGFGGTVEPKLRASIVATLNAQHNAIKTEEFAYRDTFEKKATEVTKELLANSKKKIEEEQARYGIKLQPMAGGTVVTDVGNAPELAKMQGAAKLLLPEKRAVGTARDTWDAAQQKILAKSGPLDIRETVDPALIASEKTTRKAYTDQEDKYRKLHDQQVALFPALAMFAGGEETVASLELLATANPKLLGQHIGALIVKKLENIATVQKEIGGRFNVWKQPSVMAITGNQLGTKAWLRKAMDEHARQLRPTARRRRLCGPPWPSDSGCWLPSRAVE